MTSTDTWRQAGRAVAGRAFSQVRLVAVIGLAVLAAGYDPGRDAAVGRPLALTLLAIGAGLLLVVDRVLRRRQVRSALIGAAVDAVVVLGVVWVAGPPPQSFAVVILLLPMLEAAVLGGLGALAITWVSCTTLLAVEQFVGPGALDVDALQALVVAMPLLLLAVLPLGLLGEHLVAEVARSQAAGADAEDRSRVLATLVATSADLVRPDVDAVLTGLAAAAVRLGATSAEVVDGADRVVAQAVSGTDGAVDHRWPLGSGTDPVHSLRVGLAGDRRDQRVVEAVDLLVAQARVTLQHARLVTGLQQLSADMHDQAERDPLTGLANRRGLVAAAAATPGPVGVLFCDLDGFKAVNDRRGHAAGDVLLVRIAARLAAACPEGATLARFGGDEFVVVVPGADPLALSTLARRLEIEVGRPVLLPEGAPARVGVSVGIALPATDDDIEALLQTADEAMYEVKRTRRAERAVTGSAVAR